MALAAIPGTKREVLQQLGYFFDQFASVRLDFSPYLVEECQEWLAKHQVPELRSYYLDVLDVCFIVLAGAGLEVIDKHGERGMHSVLVDMEEAFEEYLRAVLTEAPQLRSDGVRLLNGNTDGKQPLFSNTNKYEAKPDFILRVGDACLCIGDAKYKTKLEEKDRYQLITHAVSYGAPRCFLVTPVRGEAAASGPEFVGTIGPTEVYHYSFDLNGDLKTKEEEFSAWVRQEMCSFGSG